MTQLCAIRTSTTHQLTYQTCRQALPHHIDQQTCQQLSICGAVMTPPLPLHSSCHVPYGVQVHSPSHPPVIHDGYDVRINMATSLALGFLAYFQGRCLHQRGCQSLSRHLPVQPTDSAEFMAAAADTSQMVVPIASLAHRAHVAWCRHRCE